MKKNRKSLQYFPATENQDKNGKTFVAFTIPPATSEKAVTKLIKNINKGKSIADYQNLNRKA